jgi:hypothetical protein
MAAVSAAICMFGLVAAQSITGVWHGHFVIDKATLPKPANAAQAEAMKKRLHEMDVQLAKSDIKLTLNANKTFTIVGVNIPGTAGTQTSEGIYTKTATQLTLIPKKDNGKPAVGNDAKPQVVNIVAGGKKLNLLVPNTSQVKISVVFTR